MTITGASASPNRRAAAVPLPAAVYGGAGLIPFVAGAIGVWVLPPGWANATFEAVLGYGAAILAFLGAAHWGLALAGAGQGGADGAACSWRRLGWSVTPALVGWLALLLVPLLGALVQIAGFAGAFFMDVRAVRAGLMPAWYPRLRVPLTIVVIVCLGVAAARAA